MTLFLYPRSAPGSDLPGKVVAFHPHVVKPSTWVYECIYVWKWSRVKLWSETDISLKKVAFDFPPLVLHFICLSLLYISLSLHPSEVCSCIPASHFDQEFHLMHFWNSPIQLVDQNSLIHLIFHISKRDSDWTNSLWWKTLGFWERDSWLMLDVQIFFFFQNGMLGDVFECANFFINLLCFCSKCPHVQYINHNAWEKIIWNFDLAKFLHDVYLMYKMYYELLLWIVTFWLWYKIII